MAAKVIKTRDNSPAVQAVLDRADRLEVFVGFFGRSNRRRREDGNITNAQLGYIHEHGSPAANIPARPFLKPAIEDSGEHLVNILAAGLRRALQSRNVRDVDVAYERTGLAAVSEVQGYMSTARFTPLKPATIKRKGSSRPLIDTGQLRASVTHVVRSRGA